jgi:spore maturation protein B
MFSNISPYIVPVVIVIVLSYAFYKKTPVFDTFTSGVKDGLGVLYSIFPSLFALIVSVYMLKASGFFEFLSYLSAPLQKLTGFPSQALPLAFMRPISGSGGLAILEIILKDNGPDSLAGRVASVIQGSTETTFYTIALYYGAAKITKTRHTIIAASAADITGFIISYIAVLIIFR